MKVEQEFETVESGVMEATKSQAIREGEHMTSHASHEHQELTDN